MSPLKLSDEQVMEYVLLILPFEKKYLKSYSEFCVVNPPPVVTILVIVLEQGSFLELCCF